MSSQKEEENKDGEYDEDKEALLKELTEMEKEEEYYSDYEEDTPEKSKWKPNIHFPKTENPQVKEELSQEIRKHKRRTHSLFGALFRSKTKQDHLDLEELDQKLSDIQSKIHNYSYHLRKLIYKSRLAVKEYFKHPNSNSEERNNLRVLIIINSIIRDNDKYFVQNNEFFLNSMLLRHIFLYAYQIPEQNILITSPNHENILSNYRIFLLNEEMANSEQFLYCSITFPYILNHYIFLDDVYITQAENIEYRFTTSLKTINQIIKPFNRKFLKLLHTDENSNLLIFFLDQEEKEFDYQYYIKHLLELNPKQFVVFNESFHSGSLLELIHICERLQTNFSNLLPTELDNLFIDIFNMCKENKQSKSKQTKDVNKENQDIPEQTIQTISSIEYDIKTTLDGALSKYNIQKETFNFNEIVNIINKLSELSIISPIKPSQFLEFKKKSIIFCSSPYNIASMSLPFQYLETSSRIISSRGTFYSSILIHCLLNPKPDLNNPFQFAHEIQNRFQQIKRLYKDTFLSQIKIDESDKEQLKSIHKTEEKINEILSESYHDYEETEKYFEVDYRNETTFLTQSGLELPSFFKLIVPKQYWCIEELHLTPDIFSNLKYYQFDVSILKHRNKQSDENHTTEEENDKDYIKYGPTRGVEDVTAFYLNYFQCVEDNLSKYDLDSKFSDIIKWKIPFEFKEEKERIFSNFEGVINKYCDALNARAIQKLFNLIKYNLENNFSDTTGNPSEQDIYLQCCELALCTLTKVWKGFHFNERQLLFF